jgi:hypothetical protein
MNEKIMKMAIFALVPAIFGTAILAHPENNALAQTTQGNVTGNLTAVIDVDTLSNNLKERHPILAQFAGDEDEDIIVKITVMDPKEAAKTTLALNILRMLQQYKQLD